jgi:hypothetical protein
MSVFKLMRVVLLLSVLFVILLSTWMTEKQMAAWERPILVTVYPIVADEEPESAKFAKEISTESFNEVNQFFNRESMVYSFTVTPAFRFQIAPVSHDKPPQIPHQFNTAAIAWWSLKMRWWAWMKDLRDGMIQPDIQMFLMVHSLNGKNEVGISVGMRKGRYGIVKAYARESLRPENLVVFTHELLHVLGATDKYVISTGEPIFPDGFARPDQRPLFPQTHAEIMGGRTPLNSFTSEMPDSLEQCKIGRATAREIGFYAQLLDN